MAYHDDLLAHALGLVQTQPASEVTLRRAVSAAYYAAFHLLIFEATQHWDNSALRPTLARAYDHALMKSTSKPDLRSPRVPLHERGPKGRQELKQIARGFAQLQEDRHFADYNLTEPLLLLDALDQVRAAEQIFRTMQAIKTEQIVQEYLTLLLVKKR